MCGRARRRTPLPHIRPFVSTTTASQADDTTQTALDPTDPTRASDCCGPGVKPLVLTGHGPAMDMTLAWCGRCFTARERLGLLAGAVLDDRRQ